MTSRTSLCDLFIPLIPALPSRQTSTWAPDRKTLASLFLLPWLSPPGNKAAEPNLIEKLAVTSSVLAPFLTCSNPKCWGCIGGKKIPWGWSGEIRNNPQWWIKRKKRLCPVVQSRKLRGNTRPFWFWSEAAALEELQCHWRPLKKQPSENIAGKMQKSYAYQDSLPGTSFLYPIWKCTNVKERRGKNAKLQWQWSRTAAINFFWNPSTYCNRNIGKTTLSLLAPSALID